MAYDKLLGLVQQAESGGRDYDARGNIITSPVGAKGRMQVMDGTNRDPGFGVQPARDDSLEERARVGQDYVAAMVQNYGGDVRKGLAAYNAGPGNVDRALAKAQAAGDSNWMKYLPKPEETIPYVDKIVAGMGGQGGGMLDRAAAAILPSAEAAGVPKDVLSQVKWDDAPAADTVHPEVLAQVKWDDAPNSTPPEKLDTDPSETKGGVGGGFFMGAIRDPLDAGAQLLTRGVRAAAGLIPDAIGGETARNFMDQQVADVDKQVRTANAEYDQSRPLAGRDGFDAARLAGNVVSPANIPGAGLMGGARSVGQLAVRGAAAGAVGGALQPVVNDQRNFGTAKGEQIAMGAGAGAVLSPVASKVASVVGDAAAGIAQRFRGRSISDSELDAQILAAIQRSTPEGGIKDLSEIPEAVRSGLRDQVRASMQAGDVADPAALARRADFDTLGIAPTQGQVTRDPMQFAREKNLRGVDLGNGQNALADRFAQQNQLLTSEFDRMGAGAADSPYQAGNKLMGALRDADAPYKRAVDDLYNNARDSGGRYANLDAPHFSRTANDALDEGMLGRFLPGEVRGLLNDVSSGEIPFNVNTAVQMDGVLSAAQRKAAAAGDKPAQLAIGKVRDALNNAPIESSAGQEAKSAFDVGRKAAALRFGKIEDSPALKAALDNADPENFVQKYIIGSTTNETQSMVKVLGSDKEAMAQARAQIAEYLRQAAFKTNSTGDKAMAVASYQAALKRLGDDKLLALFTPAELARMKTVSRVASAITTQPAGAAVNNSNTASATMNMLADAAGSLGRIPGGRMVRDQIRGWQNEMKVNNALSGKPPAQAAKMAPGTVNRLMQLLAPLPVAGGQASGSSRK